jgi:hypothetical protein
MSSLDKSPALWNRRHLDLRSDEVLAQLLDRGTMADWRELHSLARSDSGLRRRILHIIATVPLPMPHLWLAALADMGEQVDFAMVLPQMQFDL